MKKVLVINASARTAGSKSRELTEVFIECWKRANEHPIISFRELGSVNVPHINEGWIAASFKPAAVRSQDDINALKTSNDYISELHNADIIVLGSPMYNWSIPSTLKAYLDHVLRVNETFRVNGSGAPDPYTGLLQNKTLLLLLARGGQGYEEGEQNEHLNFQSTYLKTVFGVMGITDIHVIAINGASLGDRQVQLSTAAAHEAIHNFVIGESVLK